MHISGCFKNITSGSGLTSGHIDSPNYPHKYLINSSCEWLITAANRNSRILLTFDIFTMEGSVESMFFIYSLIYIHHLLIYIHHSYPVSFILFLQLRLLQTTYLLICILTCKKHYFSHCLVQFLSLFLPKIVRIFQASKTICV